MLISVAKAADLHPPIRPALEPLAVVRLADFDLSEKLEVNPAARLLGLDRRDFSGRLPGLAARTPSLRSWPRSLRESGALDFWYALFPDGLNLAAAMGGDWPDGGGTGNAAGDFSAWLKAGLFDPGAMPILADSPIPGVSRRTLARDNRILGLTLADEDDARTDPGAGWRESLDSFLRRRPEGLAAWVNPRPLLGLASLVSGIDWRGSLAALGMRLPDALEVELAPETSDFGLNIRLNRLLSEPAAPAPAPGLSIRRQSDSKRMTATISNPSAIFPALGLDGNPLFAAGLDFRAVVPERLRLVLWLDGDGSWRWFAVGTFRDGTAFRRHFRRLLAWLDILASSPASGLSLTPAEAGFGDNWRRLEWNGFPLTAGMAETGGVPLFLVAGRPEDCPKPEEFIMEPGTPAPWLTWEISPDGGRQALDKLAETWRSGDGTPRENPDLARMSLPLASGESGSMDFSGTSLTLNSRNGASLLAVVWRLAGWRFQPSWM